MYKTHTRTHARTHARMHARTHARTHTRRKKVHVPYEKQQYIKKKNHYRRGTTMTGGLQCLRHRLGARGTCHLPTSHRKLSARGRATGEVRQQPAHAGRRGPGDSASDWSQPGRAEFRKCWSSNFRARKNYGYLDGLCFVLSFLPQNLLFYFIFY